MNVKIVEVECPECNENIEVIVNNTEECNEINNLKNIIFELEEWLKYQFEHTSQQNNYYSVLDKIQELKEKYNE